MVKRNSSQGAPYGPEPASKIQISHELLCMSLFLKKIKEGERKSWFWFGKEGIFSFNVENLWYATSVCCCLEKKTAGKFSINTFITSPGLKELQWAFFKAQPLCAEGTVTHVYTQKAAFTLLWCVHHSLSKVPALNAILCWGGLYSSVSGRKPVSCKACISDF